MKDALQALAEELRQFSEDVLHNEGRPSAEGIAGVLRRIAGRLDRVADGPALVVSSPAEGARILGGVPPGEYRPGDTFPVVPLAEGADDVPTNVDSGVEEAGRGVPGGGGSADDHPRGGDPVGHLADDERLTDPTEAAPRTAAPGESD